MAAVIAPPPPPCCSFSSSSVSLLGRPALPPRRICLRSSGTCRSGRILALVVDPSDSARGSVEEYIARMEKAWLISKQPRPVSCISCHTKGHIECPWCKGTGFFILGDNMLCQVPSRNTTCLICVGQGSVQCKDCKGTGYRARWMGNPASKINESEDSSHM